MKIKTIIVAYLVCACYSVAAEPKQQLPANESVAIKTFFADFKNAFNAKDVERVKKMSGATWDHWSKAINEGKLGLVDIQDIVVGKQTNVITKCIAVDDKKRTYPAKVVFMMKQDGGVYSIEKMRFPDSERRHAEFDDAYKKMKQLVAAINNRDLGAVKNLATFGDVADFEDELSARGLEWIKNAMDNDINVSEVGSGVSREGNRIIGRIYVPCAIGGTNVLRKVLFKDGKIDRAVPREESADELRMRAEREKREEQRQSEKRMQEDYDRVLKQQLIRAVK